MSKSVLLKYFILFFFASTAVSVIFAMIRGRWSLGTKISLIAAFLIFGVAADAYLIEPYWIQVREVVIHDAALAAALGNTKIVQISDIHLSRGLKFREKQLIHKVNALQPDILFFTGDLFNKRDQIAPALELLKSFKAGTLIGVPGDTDKIVMSSRNFAITVSPFMKVPLNDSLQIPLKNGQWIEVLGIDDERLENLDKALRASQAPVLPRILLSPAPEIFEEAVKKGINLVLTGDTHGGQVGLDFMIRLSDYANRSKYMRGLFRKAQTAMYVNRGIGTTTRAMRFLCRPEIAVLKVVP